MITLTGKKISEGIAIGKLTFYKRDIKEIKRIYVKDVEKEIQRYKKAREKAIAEKKAIMKKQHEELKAKLKPILTEEQFKKWEAQQNENIEKVKERKKHKKQ